MKNAASEKQQLQIIAVPLSKP